MGRNEYPRSADWKGPHRFLVLRRDESARKPGVKRPSALNWSFEPWGETGVEYHFRGSPIC